MHFSDVEVGKQLVVGNGTYYDALGLGKKAIRGSAYCTMLTNLITSMFHTYIMYEIMTTPQHHC